MKKGLKWGLGIGLVATLASLAWFWPRLTQIYYFNPMVSEAEFAPPANTLEAQRQDLKYLATVLEYDRSFSPEARSDFTARISALLAAEESLGDAEFYMETQSLMALADNAHTTGDFVSAFRQFNRSGLDFYRFADGLMVTRAHSPLAEHLGKRLVEIEGRPIPEVLAQLEKYSGGPKQRRDLISLYYLRSPELLHAAGLAEAPNRLTLTLASGEGELETVELEAIGEAAETEFSYRHPYATLSPWPLSDEAGEWVRALDAETGSEIPLTLSDPETLTLSQRFGGGVYVRTNYLMDTDYNPVASALPATLDNAPEGGFSFIVLDLRWNPGGDLSNAIPFAKKAGESLAKDGTAYAIVGPQTFSAAIVAAALLKQHVGGETLIIGEPMGDRPQFWAESGEAFVLPNSGYYIGYATGYHDWENGCDDEIPWCFPASRDEAADIGSLALDEEIRPAFAQYKAGEDPVLDWILKREN